MMDIPVGWIRFRLMRGAWGSGGLTQAPGVLLSGYPYEFDGSFLQLVLSGALLAMSIAL
jgi:hypothetical protein